MDVRIFILTVFLSVVLLGISITEFLTAWDIMQDATEQAEWKQIVFFLITETIPVLVIVCLLTRSTVSDKDTKENGFIVEDGMDYALERRAAQ